jgi:hypothetical protein
VKLEDIVDGYDLKARVAPAAINFFPALFTIYYCFPALYNSPLLAAGSGLIGVAVIYLCSMLNRYLGLREQNRLWLSWGGAPSTRFIRWRDLLFSTEQKKRIRTALFNEFHLQLLSEDQEMKNSEKADECISRAFLDVKEYLRKHEQAVLVDKHNVEYGFARNLYAGRYIVAVAAVIGLLLCGFESGNRLWSLNAGVGLNLIFMAVWLPIAAFVLPDLLKRNADAYAERAWITFLRIAEKNSRQP